MVISVFACVLYVMSTYEMEDDWWDELQTETMLTTHNVQGNLEEREKMGREDNKEEG